MQLVTPEALKKRIPLPPENQAFIEKSRASIEKIITGEDGRIALVVGPCSIHERISAIDYAEKLKALSSSVESTAILVMRVFTEKARTHRGWKGFLSDPLLNGSFHIERGICDTRQLLVELAKREVPVAAEILDPLAHHYFNDLLSWGFIGARTSESQPHRQIASALDFPVGFKNNTEGNISSAVNAVVSAREAHCFLSVDNQGRIALQKSPGNPLTHIVLRGSHKAPNYDRASVAHAKELLSNQQLPERMLIDCAHGNCNKEYERQCHVFLHLIDRIKKGEKTIFGLMLESHLQEANLCSLTDPCISWESTQELILHAHHQLCSSISCC